MLIFFFIGIFLMACVTFWFSGLGDMMGGSAVPALITAVIATIIMGISIAMNKPEPPKEESYTNLSMEQIQQMTHDAIHMDTSNSQKPASVTKRAVAGSIIGGIPGAIIGAATAIDKNNKMNSK